MVDQLTPEVVTDTTHKPSLELALANSLYRPEIGKTIHNIPVKLAIIPTIFPK
jgi:hypothetical protein